MSTAHAARTTRVGSPLTPQRIALAINAVVAAVALAIKFVEAATTADPQFSSVFGRVTNELCYFTIQSNIIVLVVCAALAWQPQRWRAFAGVPRLVGLVCIVVTGTIYYALLAGDQHFTGIAKIGDVLAHAVSPILYVGTWLMFDRHGDLKRHHAVQMLAFPLFWVTLTLVRGAFIHVYPYGFVDVQANGYIAVIVTVAALTAAAGGLAMVAVWFDMRGTRSVIRPFRRPLAIRVVELEVPRRRLPVDR
jgi:hypothetical protein